MRGSSIFMIFRRSILIKVSARFVLCAGFLFVGISASAAQEPPLSVPVESKLPAQDPNAITVGGWLLYPTLRLYSLYSDNLFFTPISPISAGAIGVTPSMVAVWSNGIHTTTLYGNIDRQDYPTANDVNTLDGRAGFTQRYEAMRDLIFTVNVNYAHQTWAPGLQNSIQAPSVAPTITVLPNGNTVLPNGTILSPGGQTVGQTLPTVASGAQLFVNPSNQYTSTFSVDKIFNQGILSLSESLNRTEFQNPTAAQPNFNSRTFIERAAFWLGPLFYLYSNGSLSTSVTDATSGSAAALPSISTNSYRVIGGVGTRQSALIFGSVYLGHQASDSGGATAGGAVYGGALTYQASKQWSLTGTIDRTVNVASQPFTANLALTLPSLTAEQVPIGVSTAITSTGVHLTYEITPQWFMNCQAAYSRVGYIDSPRLDNGWLLDASLRYDIWRNLSLSWEYRYTTIISNTPFASATANTGIMGATYKF